MRRSALLLVGALLVSGCTSERSQAPGPAAESSAPRDAAAAALQEPSGPATVVAGSTPVELAVATSAALYRSAPVVVLAADGDSPAQQRAAAAAEALGMPLLLVPGIRGVGSGPAGDGPASTGARDAEPPGAAVQAEIERLAAQAVLAVGAGAGTWAERLEADVVPGPEDDAQLDRLLRTGTRADRNGPELPRSAPPEPATGTVVLTTADPASAAEAATARAAGAQVVRTAGPDPRGDADAVRRLAELAPRHVIGLGSVFGDAERLASRVATARTGVELPGGGQLVLPGKRYVALYGHPGTSALGVLGEQGPDASVRRATRLAEEYAAAGQAVRQDAVVVPTFEIIATVADSSPGRDGDYSSESSLDHLRPLVDAAGRAGVYVLLDLQPGHTDFLTQARRYEQLLALPHVGLALDPEWRLAPGQRHLREIGSVGADEVNDVADWLAALVRERRLPQKMLLLHQFRTSMLPDRERIRADRDELAVVTQMDGHGPPSVKLDTWRVLLRDPPAGMAFGWKNFYDEDRPTFTPAQTLAIEPTPVFVSYQ